MGTLHHDSTKSTTVWIEWKPYQPLDASLKPSTAIVERVQKLAALLADPNKPSSLRVATCLGYFDDGETVESITGADGDNDDYGDGRSPEWRFGLIFERDHGTKIVSLQDILTGSPQPSLTRRVDLATLVANSILSLHAVNWLHKSLRSSNILFVAPAVTANSESQTSEVKPDLTNPVLAGFDYARPADSSETELPTIRSDHIWYRHPDSHGIEEDSGERYVKTFDLYSLGVILVEIALWQPASSILRPSKPASTASSVAPSRRKYQNHRDRLLNDETIGEALEGGAGVRYAVATRSCLEGKVALGLSNEDDETSELVGVKLQRAFQKEVVRRLEGIQT